MGGKTGEQLNQEGTQEVQTHFRNRYTRLKWGTFLCSVVLG